MLDLVAADPLLLLLWYSSSSDVVSGGVGNEEGFDEELERDNGNETSDFLWAGLIGDVETGLIGLVGSAVTVNEEYKEEDLVSSFGFRMALVLLNSCNAAADVPDPDGLLAPLVVLSACFSMMWRLLVL